MLGFTMTETHLDMLCRLPEYREKRKHIFQSEGALQWFVRRHRRGLVECGALMLLTGQWHAHEARFDAFVLEAGADAARVHAAVK